MDRADELVAPGRERRDVVGPRLDTREDVALEDAGARRVLDRDVVGEPGSLLANAIWKAWSAGALSSVWSKAMFRADTSTTVPAPDGAALPLGPRAVALGGAEADGATEADADGATDALGSADGTGVADGAGA